MNLTRRIACFGFAIMASLLISTNTAHSQEAVVRAVLFYSPTCPHCHQVLTVDLPPLVDEFGEQLMIVAVNTSSQGGYELYRATVERFQIPEEQQVVPLLVVGETILTGAYDIPTQLPTIIEDGLDEGGTDWPDIPGLLEALESQPSAEAEATPTMPQPTPEEVGDKMPESEEMAQSAFEETPAPQEVSPESGEEEGTTVNDGRAVAQQAGTQEAPAAVTEKLTEAVSSAESMSWRQRFAQDRVGNTISVAMLLVMVVSVLQVGSVYLGSESQLKSWPTLSIPVMLIVGAAVAGYMSYVELTRTDAVCGPVGDCNTVQQSPYAYLFGIIPVGLFGLVGYFALGIAWVLARFGSDPWRRSGAIAFWWMSLFGVLFSIYLTFLEPFVIGAFCAWCLTSALVMTLLLWATTEPARIAWRPPA